MRITWLADVLRAAGLTVVEHSGWKTHERPGSWEPRYLVAHATAAPRSQSDDTQVRVVRDGRSDLRGPIAQACIDRRGRWHVLSAGRCNTTLTGTAGPYDGLGNTYAIGIEACNDNRNEIWPDVQYDAYVRGVAAICKRLGWPASRVVGHREHTPRHKTDPTFSMTKFRADVTKALAGNYQEDDMAISQADFNERFLGALKNPTIAAQLRAIPWQYVGGGIPAGKSTLGVLSGIYAAAIKAAGHDVDEQAIAAAVLAGLPAEEIAASIPAELAEQVAQRLADRLAA
ncbi:peptidoglycan recognition protein family protein [Actinoplanes aureus]|uniref:N-acetylmuramoyl-L-alanine amidase n=1 Tax=Actinoplanes aureus TaxID=2792083 RepID=A0A931BZZ6_9ACTN|nr:N-acetylmuramoyl-L-alanine amidase [Actinoplanes aureus]MBG0560735.1 N-acetylmuramoyl-L-alanine amidase [Actinoplanes aureus]